MVFLVVVLVVVVVVFVVVVVVFVVVVVAVAAAARGEGAAAVVGVYFLSSWPSPSTTIRATKKQLDHAKPQGFDVDKCFDVTYPEAQ